MTDIYGLLRPTWRVQRTRETSDQGILGGAQRSRAGQAKRSGAEQTVREVRILKRSLRRAHYKKESLP